MKLTGNKSQCSACGEIFSSVGTFDRHRVGKHGINRRCLTAQEMEADGMRLIGGIWKGEAMPEIAFGRPISATNGEGAATLP